MFQRYSPGAWGICLLIAVASAGCRGSADSSRSPKSQKPAGNESHQRMIRALLEIQADTAARNPYLGDGRIEPTMRELSRARQSGSDIQQARLLFNLGMMELRLGHEKRSIDYLQEAYTMAPRLVAKGLAPSRVRQMAFELGVAQMRKGETDNCCLLNTHESCILPIQGAGVHTEQGGSMQAIRRFLEVLDATPPDSSMHLEARWLLNVAFMTIGGHPHDVPAEHLIPAEAFEAKHPFPRFRNIASQLELDTFSVCGGAVGDDLNNDGYLDLLVSTWDTSGQLRLWINQRDGTFEERTREAGLAGIYGGLNLVPADYNNDGNLDVLVLRGAWLFEAGQHPNSLLRNNGDGTFTDVTFLAGLGNAHYPTQTAAWADFDNDGDVDLYVGNESTSRLRAPSQLFRNNGDETFTDVAGRAGVKNLRFAKAVVWGDYDNDRFPDLYVSNLREPNRLYRNRGDATFEDVAPELDVVQPSASFPAWFWDVNNDGALDLFVAAYAATIEHVARGYLGQSVPQQVLPRLYQGDGNGRFTDIAARAGVNHPTLPMGSNFGDLDNDGFLDFYLGTGDPDYKNLMPNRMYANRRGERFADVTTAGGFGHIQKGHAVVFADFDHDGDADLFEQMGGAFLGDKFYDALYENPGFGNHWLAVKLVGKQSNRAAIGARIRAEVVDDGGRRSIYRHVNTGGSFGANPLRQTIGLGGAQSVARLEVFWPVTGKTQMFDDVPADQFLRIVEGEEEYIRLNLPGFRLNSRTTE